MIKSDKEFSPSNHPQISEDVRQYTQAFLAAKRNFRAAIKSTKGNFGKYANLEEVYEAVEDALNDNNIIIKHLRAPQANGSEILHTRLIHTLSGQYMEDACFLTCEKPGNQAKGSSLTYMKRYALLNLCGIAAEDDDAQAEQKYIDKNPKVDNYYNKPKDFQAKPEVISQDQLEQLEYALQDHPDICETVKKALKINKLSDMPKGVFLASLKRIEELKRG